MTKIEICAIEDANPGQVYLYPEGAFYKAYQKSAWILRTKVHPFKLSSRSLKGLEAPLLSVGFPQSSLDKFSTGLVPCPGLSVLVGVSSLCSWEESEVR